MAQTQRRKISAAGSEKSHRMVLESIPDTQMNVENLINSPSSKNSKVSAGEKAYKASLPKPQSEVHLVPYTFTPKTNELAAKGLNLASSSSSKEGIENFVTRVKKSKKSLRKSENFYKEHLFNTFQALKFVRKLPAVDLLQLQQKKVLIPKKVGFENRKTLVFDLDETLVHCVEDPSEKADIEVVINFPSGEWVQAGVNVRPYAKECLMEAAKDFEVIVFTASHQCYADAVLDHLDPDRTLIHSRLYRENCIVMKNMHIKDLRILRNRKLKNIVIVDNAAYSFAYQLENGIPIISWHNDPHDRELFNLIDYLKVLANAEDVRDVNREVFRMNSFYQDYIEEYLKVKKC
jgi:CTD small phosphatase-like protein 2